MTIIEQNKIRIKLQAYDHKLLTLSCEKIVHTINRTNAKTIEKFIVFLNHHM